MGVDTGYPKQAEIKAAALQYLNMDSLRHIGMIEPILHDTAEILYASNNGVFVMEKKSGAYFLSAQETSLGIDLLGRTEGIALLCVFQSAFIDLAVQKYKFEDVLPCWQCVYSGDRIDTPVSNMEIRLPTISELTTIKKSYKKISVEEIDRLFETNNLFVGIQDQSFVGFIGRHLEGSIGLLNVFPEYQGHGYGTILESYLINKLIDQGCKPYCQVEVENQKSINFHRKLGFEISNELLYWMF